MMNLIKIVQAVVLAVVLFAAIVLLADSPRSQRTTSGASQWRFDADTQALRASLLALDEGAVPVQQLLYKGNRNFDFFEPDFENSARKEMETFRTASKPTSRMSLPE